MATIMVVAAPRGGQQQPLPHPDTLSPQQLREWVLQRGRPGGGGYSFMSASESAAALGASESAAALGASASTTTGPASAEALHTFILDSGASRYFFRDCTTVTPLAAPVPVSLADPSGGLVVARASTSLPCPAVLSGSLPGLHLPSFSTNLPPGSSLYTLTTASAQVAASSQMAASSQVSASGQFAVSCSCRVLSHQTLLWHHRLGHPSMLRLRSMHSRLLVSGLPRSLPPLPRSPAPPCLPCVEGRQRATPHSSEFPPTTAPLQTLPMDMWGLAPISGMDQERYFLLVVDDYTRYTTVFPLRHKADVSGVLIPWIRATCHQLREQFRRTCEDEGIRRSFTLPASPQQNGIAERLIGLIMEVARTSMIHVAAPHFLWPFAVRYAAHQLNLWPRCLMVWGALSLVRDTTASKLSPRTLRCAFLGFLTDAPPWQFYHPRSRCVFSSQNVTFDESVCFYRLHLQASHPVPLAPLFLVPVPPTVDPLPPQCLAPSGVSHVDPPPLIEPLEISSDSSGPAEGGDPAADDAAATLRSPRLEAPPGFPPQPSSSPVQPVAVDTGAAGGGDTRDWGEGSGGTKTGGAESPSGGVAVGARAAGLGVGPQLLRLPANPTDQQLREWVVRQGRSGVGAWSFLDAGGTAGTGAVGAGGAAGAGGTGAAGTGGTAGGGGGTGAAGVGVAAGGAAGAGAAGAGGAAGGAGGIGGACTGGTAGGAGGTGAAGAAGGAAGAGAAVAGAAGAGGAAGGAGGTGAAGVGGTAGGNAGAGAASAGGTAAGAGAASAGGTAAGAAGAGAAGAGGTGAAGAGGTAGGITGAGGVGAGGAAGPGGARTRGGGAIGAGGAAGARGTGAGGTGGAGAANGTGYAPSQPFFYPQPQSSLPPPGSALCQVLSIPSSTGLTPPLLYPPTDQSLPQLLPGSPLPAHAPPTEVTESLTQRCEPETRASTPVRARRVARPRPPPVPGTHVMALRPSSVPQRVPLLSPPTSSLPHVPDPESDLVRTTSPTVSCLLTSVVTDPAFESTAAFVLVTELVDFAARSRLDYVASLVNESECVSPPSVGGDVLKDRQFELECLAAVLPRFASMLLCPEGDPDALDIPTPRTYAEAIAGDYSSQWKTAMDAGIASWKSTGTYVDEVPPPGANIVDGMWIFRVKQPPGSLPAFKACYVARGFSHRQGVDYFQSFSPTSKMTTLWAPREWHDTLRTTLTALGFAPSFADPLLFLRTDTTLLPFYVLVYVDDLVFATADTKALALSTANHHPDSVTHDAADPPSLRLPVILATAHSSTYRPLALSSTFGRVRRAGGPYPEFVGCLMYLMTCTRPDLAYPLSLLARYVAPGRHQKQASAEGIAVEEAEDEGEADLAATTSMEAAGVADMAATTRATDAVAADSTASATIVTRADICGAIASSSLMDGPLLKAKRVEEQEEGEEDAVEAVEVAEVVLQV
ncbi:unnamed protein product [Closterium sp. NIES-54]